MSIISSANAEQQIEIAVRDEQARIYESLVRTRGEAFWEISMRTLIGALGAGDGDRLCDAGCGVGIYVRELIRLYPTSEVTAMDFSQGSLDLVRSHVDSPRLKTLCGDLVDFSLPEKADAILCTEAILHIPSHENRVRAARNLLGNLNPGGRLVLAVVPWRPGKGGEKVTDGRGKGGYYSYRFTPRELGDLMREAGFANVRVRGCVNFRGRVRSRLPRALWWTDVALSRLPLSAELGHLIFAVGERRR